jgi:hypothetical protein
MELLELWRDAAVKDGVEKKRSHYQIAQETGLSVREVIEREVALQLVPASIAKFLKMPEEPGPFGQRC